jgi:type IV pilus assembly protein PilW
VLSLLIASSIGLFLAGVVIHVYVSAKSTHDHYQAAAAATENGRFALDDIRRTLVMAGRGLPPDADPASVFGRYGTGTGPDDGNSDAVAAAYRYAGAVPCSGSADEVDDLVLGNRFEVTRGSATGLNQLSCKVNDRNRVAIVSGVERLQVLYGVDVDADHYANQYLDGATVEGRGLWGNVVAIRVGVLSGSAEFTLPVSARAERIETYELLDRIVEVPNSTHAHRVLVSTIALRNLIGVARQPEDRP